jgi:hypothetical protein
VIDRRTLFKAGAAGLLLAATMPPAELLAELAEPTRRYFPLDRTHLRSGWYDVYVQPHREGFLARWYEGETLISTAHLDVATMIAEEPFHALAPLQGLTQDFVGPQAKLQRGFFQYPSGMRPLMAEERLVQRLRDLEGQGLPVSGHNPSFETNPPLFTNRPIWGIDTAWSRT